MLKKITGDNFLEVINAILNLRKSASFICDTTDGGFVCGSKKDQKYYKVYCDHRVYKTMPAVPYQCGFYSIVPNALFGLDFNDVISTKSNVNYQIYGITVKNKFMIDELYKEGPLGFESYFREEIFTTFDGKALVTEVCNLIEEISNL